MARFESPCQIFGLFLGAALISIGVIFVLNIEASKRYGAEDTDFETDRADYQISR